MATQNWQVTAAEADERLDKWLAAPARCGSRSRALAALEHGRVSLGERELSPADAGRRLCAGERISFWPDRPGSAKRRTFAGRRVGGAQMLYEDEALLVLDKPAGLLTVPLPEPERETSLRDQLAVYLRPQGKRQPLVVHRIDRDTSGLVLFAKTPQAQQRLKDQFAAQQPERVYLAVVYGRPQPEAGIWRDLLVWDQERLRQRRPQPGDRQTHQAISRYRVVEHFAATSLLEVSLVSGKRNQIRVQAALRGHTLVGERKYVMTRPPTGALAFARQALHAHRLSFRHPTDDRPMRFEAPLPVEMEELLERLRGR